MRNLFALAATLLALALSFETPQSHAEVVESGSFSIDIPAGDLSAALQLLSKQTKTNLIYRPEQVQNYRTPGVSGTLTREQAISTLLRDTPLEQTTDTSGSILISAPIKLTQNDAQPAVTPENKATSVSDVQEVVVTAQRREERLQDVPISISVLSGDALDRSTDRGIAETLNRVPGVSTQIATVAARLGSSGGVVVMRGVPTASGVSPTAYYLDSIPFGFVKQSYTPDASSFDLDRVEVLRGPQGTLYGLSALNGVVRVLTKDANLDKVEFKARTSISNTEHGGENYRGDVALNVPLIEGKLAARAVIGYQSLGGWIDKPLEKNANDAKVGNYRLKLNAQPTDSLSMGLLAWYSRADMGAPSNAGLANAQTPYNSLVTISEPSSNDFDAYGLKIGYAFPGATLTANTSYINYRLRATFDFSPFTIAAQNSGSDTESKVFSQEVGLSSSGEGAWRWSVGGIYRDADDRQLLSRLSVTTGALLLPYYGFNIATANSKSYAIFGELTRLFFDRKLELTAGLRYFEDKVRDTEVSRMQCTNGQPGGLGSCPGQTNQALVPAPLSVINNNFDNVSPRVVLTWHAADNKTVYASVGQGYRSGQNQPFTVVQGAPGYTQVPPDELRSYEIGAKAGLLDGRFNVDAAIFYIDWKHVPQSLTIALPGPSPFIVAALVDSGSASGTGVEAGLTFKATQGLTLGANLSWNNLEVDQDVITGTQILYPKGSRLNTSPEYTLGGTANYDFPLGSTGLSGAISLGVNYMPELAVARNPALAGTAEIKNPLPPLPFTVPGGVWYSDSILMSKASIAIESPKGWSVALYGDNLNNASGLSRDNFSPRWTTYIRPRTIGLQFDYRL